MSAVSSATWPRAKGPAGSVTGRSRVAIRLLPPDALSEQGIVSMLKDLPVLVMPASRERESQILIVVARTFSRSGLQSLIGEGTSGIPVVLILDSAGDLDPRTLVHLGVQACIWRSEVTPERLRAEIVHVREHLRRGPEPEEELRSRLAAVLEQPRRTVRSGEVALSERERQVLRYVAEGFDTATIAQEMRYSDRTVKNILHSAMIRLGHGNRIQAMVHALRAGLL